MNTHDVTKDYVDGCYQCGKPIVSPSFVMDEHEFCGFKCGETWKKPEKSNWRGWLFIVIAVVFSLMLFMFAQSSEAEGRSLNKYLYKGEPIWVSSRGCDFQEQAEGVLKYIEEIPYLKWSAMYKGMASRVNYCAGGKLQVTIVDTVGRTYTDMDGDVWRIFKVIPHNLGYPKGMFIYLFNASELVTKEEVEDIELRENSISL